MQNHPFGSPSNDASLDGQPRSEEPEKTVFPSGEKFRKAKREAVRAKKRQAADAARAAAGSQYPPSPAQWVEEARAQRGDEKLAQALREAGRG